MAQFKIKPLCTFKEYQKRIQNPTPEMVAQSELIKKILGDRKK